MSFLGLRTWLRREYPARSRPPWIDESVRSPAGGPGVAANAEPAVEAPSRYEYCLRDGKQAASMRDVRRSRYLADRMNETPRNE